MTAPGDGSRRKLIEFDAETWNALELLSRDSMRNIQELADEAFADLLRKHGRPVTLKEALRESTRHIPANDPGAPATDRTAEGGRRAKRRGAKPDRNRPANRQRSVVRRPRG